MLNRTQSHRRGVQLLPKNWADRCSITARYWPTVGLVSLRPFCGNVSSTKLIFISRAVAVAEFIILLPAYEFSNKSVENIELFLFYILILAVLRCKNIRHGFLPKLRALWILEASLLQDGSSTRELPDFLFQPRQKEPQWHGMRALLQLNGHIREAALEEHFDTVTFHTFPQKNLLLKVCS